MTLEICSEGSCPIPLFLKGDAAGFALNAITDGRGWFRTSDLSRVKRALSR